jgi:hypothetical protein
MSEELCQASVDEFYKSCGLWKGMTQDQRRDKAFKLARAAVESFTAPAGDNPRNRFLTPQLMQCLMRRENSTYIPTHLNYTSCGSRKSGTFSHAFGLSQTLEKTLSGQAGLKQVDNYCQNFAGFWDKTAGDRQKESKELGAAFENCPGQSAFQDKLAGHEDAFVRKVGDSAELQIVSGVMYLNRCLNVAEASLWIKTSDRVVKEALKSYWFVTKQSSDWDSVMACSSCLTRNPDDQCCLQRARKEDDLKDRCR